MMMVRTAASGSNENNPVRVWCAEAAHKTA
jgi:hypothetical protein